MRVDGPIVFDGTILGVGRTTGVGRSFLDTLHQYTKTTTRRCVLLQAGATLDMDPRPDVEIVPVKAGPIARQMQWPKVLRSIGAALLHAPITAIPIRAPCPTIVTVHDLPSASIHLPGEPGLRHRLALKIALALSRRGRCTILVPSEATASDLRRQTGAGSAVIHLVPHGIVLPDTVGPPNGRSGPFLFLGDRRARKNVDRLQRAHEIARAMHPALPALQLVGPGQPYGYVDEATKHQLLSSCRALVHTTLFEGFGLPVLEGFAYGAPVLASNIKALAELASGAALLVDPTSEHSIAEGLLRIDHDLELRTRLAQRGRQVAAQHDIKKTADAWRSIHETMLEGRRR